MDVASPAEVAKLQKKISAINKPRFDAMPVLRHLCKVNGVRNVKEWINQPNGVFGVMPDAWSLVVSRTVGVEVGSVKPRNVPFTFHYDANSGDRAKQMVSCYLKADSERCRFLDDPRIPAKQQWQHPFTGQSVPGDLSRVAIYNCVARHAWSSLPNMHVDVSMNFVHSGLDQLEQLEDRDRALAASGAAKGSFMTIAPTTAEGVDCENVPIPTMVRGGPTHAAFVRTMMLINETNLMNGVHRVPRDVCEQAGLYVYKGVPLPSDDQLTRLMERMNLDKDDAEERTKLVDTLTETWNESVKTQEPIDAYYFVPTSHVLAWPMHSSEYLMALTNSTVRVEQLRYKPSADAEPILLGFLVAEPFFKVMRDDWLAPENTKDSPLFNKVDVRPLNEVAFNLHPFTDRARYSNANGSGETGVVALRAYMSYMVPPVGLTPEAVATLAPTLAPGVVPASEYLTQAQQRELALERFQKFGF